MRSQSRETNRIVLTRNKPKLHNNEEQQPHELAKQGFSVQLEQVLRERRVFPNIVLRQSDIKPGGRVLRMENTRGDTASPGLVVENHFVAIVYFALNTENRLAAGERGFKLPKSAIQPQTSVNDLSAASIEYPASSIQHPGPPPRHISWLDGWNIFIYVPFCAERDQERGPEQHR